MNNLKTDINFINIKADEYAKSVSSTDSFINKEQKYKADKLFKRLRKNVGNAIMDYGMIKEGDKILVCISGGKDSYAMLDLLMSLKRSAPIDFTLIPIHLESGFPNTPEGVVENHLKKTGLDYIILNKPVYEISKAKLKGTKTLCSICSRMRRGFLYTKAREIGATKVALGHHRDDILATYFLNMFYTGKLKTMPPILRTDDDTLTVIRPLSYCREKDLITLSKIKEYPVLPKGLCGFGEEQQRANIANMLRKWDKENPKRLEIIFKSLKNVSPSHLLDRELFDFSKF